MMVCWSRKPMTSASMGPPPRRSISTTAPTGAGRPATAAASPSVRTMLPLIAVGRIPSSCLSKAVIALAEQLLLNASQLRFELLIERAKLSIDATAAGSDRLVGDDFE